MSWNIPELGKTLAVLYSDKKDIQRVARGAGLDPVFIDLDGKPITVWNEVLQEAKKRTRIDSIVKVALEEYPEHEDLKRAAATRATDEPGQIRPAPAGPDVDLRNLRDVIVGAFNLSEFDAFLRLNFDIDREARIKGETREEIVLHTLLQARREGWLSKLIAAVARARPQRSDIQEICSRYLNNSSDTQPST